MDGHGEDGHGVEAVEEVADVAGLGLGERVGAQVGLLAGVLGNAGNWRERERTVGLSKAMERELAS